MKTRNMILSMLVCVFAYAADISAQVSREKRDVDAFTKIASSSGIDVIFTQENAHTLRIETDEENLNKIEVSVQDGLLTLKRKKGEQFKKRTKVKAYVSAKELNKILLSGGADFYSKEITTGEKIDVAASGGSDIEINRLKADVCNLALSGGSDCEINKLTVSRLNLNASGGSDTEIDELTASECKLNLSGGSDCDIEQLTTDRLTLNSSGGSDAEIDIISANMVKVSASGGSDITLSGKAKNVTINRDRSAGVNTKRLTHESIIKN